MNKRPQAGLHVQLVNTALQNHHHNLALRSENHENFLDLFVDHNQLDLVKNTDWQVIYGRRGTGKTFLLKVLNEQSIQKQNESRVISIYITAQDCLASAMGKIPTDVYLAVSYFQTFIKILTSNLINQIDKLDEKNGFLDWLHDIYKKRKNRITDLLLQILSLTQDGITENIVLHDSEITINKKNSINGSVSAGVGLDIGADILKGSINVKGNIEESMDSAVSKKFGGAPVFRFGEIRQKIVELLDLMEVCHLNILIDEWSTLDPTASTSIQPIFAELLKRTFSGTKKISVKIATNKYQTKFSNRANATNYKGLELNADIFLATNLDYALNTSEEKWDFFSALLFKRLALATPTLKYSFVNPRNNKVDLEFVFSIFKDDRAFNELINGSDGIPRDFLNFFSILCRKSKNSINHRWDASFIRNTIWEHVSINDNDQEVVYLSETDQLLYKSIKTVVAKTNSRLFLIANDDVKMINSSIEELLEKRIIHVCPRNLLPEEINDIYRGYFIQYGLWLLWATNRMDTTNTTAEVLTIAQEITSDQIINISVIDYSILKCKVCEASFHKEARSFVVKGLCPECFSPA